MRRGWRFAIMNAHQTLAVEARGQTKMIWTPVHRSFAVIEMIRHGCYVRTQRAFRLKFGLGRHDKVPHRNTIKRWLEKFETCGSTARKKRREERLRRTMDTVSDVRAAVERSPQRSARKIAPALQLSNRTVRRILHEDLALHPYRPPDAHELKPDTWDKRLDASRTMLQRIPENDIVICSDEAHFHLYGTANHQNDRWSTANPRVLHERPLHCPRVTVFCAISAFGVWGPYFFEEDGCTVTVNTDRYIDLLNRSRTSSGQEWLL